MIEATGSSPRDTPRPTILVIDDDKAIVHSLVAILEVEGFTVLTAGDGRAGVSGFQRMEYLRGDRYLSVMAGLSADR